MTVYVDDMKAPFRGMILCHMIADTDDELHTMAARIGLRRNWFQGDHYDISLGKRVEASHAGARRISRKQCGLMITNRRAGWPMGGTLQEAEMIFRVRTALRNGERMTKTQRSDLLERRKFHHDTPQQNIDKLYEQVYLGLKAAGYAASALIVQNAIADLAAKYPAK